ncbi:Tetratricopeptide-like helical protein [Azotobacter vinelandii CA]|uniref:Tetratricopeptide-like helical protein n=2 Tax=Azotobacter vinelandii TaxID=354 RepID=C1DIF9_AZOVD|nr:tetratricopeptide repeat protein [Azotobacter vinelandii]ACO78640.1 Tetratricopeptide-like helical protein [Azotobacter vinelandii DJ]AGK16679.1 Tetratricopeptide-like helical protein [Azotobacter vinelandii CA]AGK20619.1 Tetratricopeptide-like helical protein [Azotobacter vinelandii CA6]WKN24319.1 tetratricopeptide repeat protein [Azotobacter vinelandii]SFX90620.1 Tetratrico peptide repeat-containing protein [Azotobacter vinelandii]
MKARSPTILLLAGMAAANPSPAADGSLESLADIARRQGFGRACPQIGPRLEALEEPGDATGKDWRAYVTLKAGCLLEARRDAEAIAFLEARLARGGRAPQLLEILGTGQFRSGLDAQAIASFEEALAKGLPERTRPNVYSKLATAYLKQASANGQPADPAALAQAERYARLALDSTREPAPAVYSQLALVKSAQQKHDEAIELLEEALEKNATYEGWPSPGVRKVMDAQFLMSLGQVHYRKGEKERGRLLMDAAVETAPSESQKNVLDSIRDSTLDPRPAEQLQKAMPPFVPLDKGV